MPTLAKKEERLDLVLEPTNGQRGGGASAFPAAPQRLSQLRIGRLFTNFLHLYRTRSAQTHTAVFPALVSIGKQPNGCSRPKWRAGKGAGALRPSPG